MAEEGIVILVGAGPGDPGLLTLAGRAALRKADVILYDRLIEDSLIGMLPPSAILINVGKNKGSHPIPQDEINRLLVQYAREGKTVVRLKGGDPFLFGRGGEELEHAAKAGIPFRMIPGVSSALAAPACAGIPVTHREYSSSVHIFTGHGKEGTPPDIPYEQLAKIKGTLIFMMGLSTMETICDRLVQAGLSPDTPAALVENGTRTSQRRLSATLRTLAERARDEAFSPPSVLVVGSVVKLADTLDWTGRLPLCGKRMLVISSAETGNRLADLLRERGCAVDVFAGIALERLPLPDSFWHTIATHDWLVFTSRFGVECFFDSLLAAGFDVRLVAGLRFAAVGLHTGQALLQRGIRPDFVPNDFNGLALGTGLAGVAAPQDRVLLFRAESGGRDLPDVLRREGVAFSETAAYRTIPRVPDPATLDKVRAMGYDALAFTSSSAVKAFADSVPAGCPLPPAFCIGEATAKAAEECGMRAVFPSESTLAFMVDTITADIGLRQI